MLFKVRVRDMLLHLFAYNCDIRVTAPVERNRFLLLLFLVWVLNVGLIVSSSYILYKDTFGNV